MPNGLRRKLEGITAVITGAASGLGAATARRFAAEGANLVLADMDEERAAALAGELDGALVKRTDVTREEDLATLLDFAHERWGRVDCMINNAGVLGSVGGVREIKAEHWRATMAILLDGVFFGMKHAARVMVPQQGGCILSTASTAGLGANGPHAYGTAKAAIIHLTRSIGAELAQYGVRVNAIAPGVVPTPLAGAALGSDEAARERSAQTSMLQRPIEAGEIAAGFAYLASDEARNITGQTLIIDGGFIGCGGPLAVDFASAEASFVGPSLVLS